MASDDVEAFHVAVSHLPAGLFESVEIRKLRAWLAAHKGDTGIERRALQDLIGEDPGNTQALEKLAALANDGAAPRCRGSATSQGRD